jgi:hypothetical protein
VELDDNVTGTGQFEIDTKLLSSAIIELNISRKNITLYPVSHPIIEKAVTRAHGILQDLFQTRDMISIGISKDTLIVDQNYLDKKNTVYKDFAQAMNSKNIASVTFRSGLTVNDLNGFLVVTSLSDDALKERGGLQKTLSDENITGISISEIDYDSFQLTSEDEISQKKKTEETGSGGLWDSFVYRLMGDSTDALKEGEGADKDAMIKVSSKRLAKMINDSRVQKSAEEHSYDEVIADYLREAGKKTGVSEDEKKRLIKDVADFTSELSPEMRKQLLRSTLKSENQDMDRMKDFISDLSSEAILETLEEVSDKRLSLPKTILNLLEKFASVNKGMTVEDETYRELEKADDIDIKENVTELLFEDHQTDFTPEGYQAALDKFTSGKNAEVFKTKYPEEYKEFKNSFTDEFIDFRYIITLIEIAKNEDDPDDFNKILDSLSETSIILIETGQYLSAKTALRFFNRVANSDEFPSSAKEAASNKINDFKNLKVTDEMISGLKQWGKERFDEIKEILVMFQDITITPLLRELSLEDNAKYRKLYINVISAMDKRVGTDLVKHLNHKKWYFVRNMIFLLREIKADEYIEEIKKCFNHENNMVKIEVLKSLLTLSGNVGLDKLKTCLESDDKSFANSCTLLAGSYKITDLTPVLIAKLNKKCFMTKANLSEKKVFVKSLCDMGDKRALPHFKNILKSNSIFFRSNHNDLKLKIYKGLNRFEHEDISEFIDMGLNSSNKHIQAICRQMQ